MRFTGKKRRSAPSVIIISLIDVLLVVLIFLMVTTTFKQQPSVKVTLPSSAESVPGASKTGLIITIPKGGPLYMGTQPVTMERLSQHLASAAKENPEVSVSIRADSEASFGQVWKVRDAAAAAKIKALTVFTKSGIEP